jgi:hypothetical protein
MEQSLSEMHIPSLSSPGKKCRHVWHEKFDGDTQDHSKWNFRLHLMQRYSAYTEECATQDSLGNLLLSRAEKGGNFYTMQLQKGSSYLEPDAFVVGYVRVFDVMIGPPTGVQA